MPSDPSPSFLRPFSDRVLALLPGKSQAQQSARQRATRSDRVPDVSVRAGEQQPLLSDIDNSSYASTSTPAAGGANLIRVPKKVATVINVEPKVWFANERTWLAYLSVAVLLGTLSGGLFAGGGEAGDERREKLVKVFGTVYGVLALATAVYGYAVFQKRVTMIKRRSAAAFDEIVFPVLVALAIFGAIATNLILRISDFRAHLNSPDHRSGHHHANSTSF